MKDKAEISMGCIVKSDTCSVCDMKEGCEHLTLPYRGAVVYNNGIELIEGFIKHCRKIDPSLKKIRITMKGDFNREIVKDFEKLV